MRVIGTVQQYNCHYRLSRTIPHCKEIESILIRFFFRTYMIASSKLNTSN